MGHQLCKFITYIFIGVAAQTLLSGSGALVSPDRHFRTNPLKAKRVVNQQPAAAKSTFQLKRACGGRLQVPGRRILVTSDATGFSEEMHADTVQER